MLGDTSYRGLDIAGLQRFDNGWMRPRNVRKVDILIDPKRHDLVDAQIKPGPQLSQEFMIRQPDERTVASV